MVDSTTVKCKICGKPYAIYMFYAGDQSCCESCRMKAKQNLYNTSQSASISIKDGLNEAPKTV